MRFTLLAAAAAVVATFAHARLARLRVSSGSVTQPTWASLDDMGRVFLSAPAALRAGVNALTQRDRAAPKWVRTMRNHLAGAPPHPLSPAFSLAPSQR